MKKITYLLSGLLLTAATMTITPANAQNLPCNGGDPVTGGCPVNSGSTMPINSGVIYLLIAGFAVGIAAVKRHETALQKA